MHWLSDKSVTSLPRTLSTAVTPSPSLPAMKLDS